MPPAARHAALDDAARRMRDDGASDAALAAFRRRGEQLLGGDSGRLAGDELEPVRDVPPLDELEAPAAGELAALLDRVAILRLNGGLGTSMGLERAKSLVEVKPGRSFLDIIATQVLALRERHHARLPLVLMSSFATARDSRAALARHAGLGAEDFLQGREPKLRADTLEPVDWPEQPELEWCPPGHGDLNVALAGSGKLAELRARGIDWAFVANADNLGATLEPRIVAWADRTGVPFVMEVVRGTPADRKGGHIARRDGRIVLRETAQVPEGDPSFGDVERWRWYNTNNLWIDLRALERLLAGDPAGPELPLIVNRKTVDPSDDSSPAVLQLETAMGAAIGAIEGARAVCVPRTRFAPVKTTDDLLVVRSDAYELSAGGAMEPVFAGDPPFVALDRDHYRHLADFEARFAHGPPSLRSCRRLLVDGDVRFGAGVVVEGEVELHGPAEIADGTRLRG
jgi:UTP--glucose-1-phosphate uridylyltransferase